MTGLKNEIWQSTKLILLALILSVGVSYVFAWTGPTATAPNGNTPAPINVSATSQVKSGGLGVTNLVADSLCLGINCITSWPSGGAGWTTSGTNIYNTNTGNVGIGTATPSQKLDVTGNVKGTGLCIGSDCRTSWPSSLVGTHYDGGMEFENNIRGITPYATAYSYPIYIPTGTSALQGKIRFSGGCSGWSFVRFKIGGNYSPEATGASIQDSPALTINVPDTGWQTLEIQYRNGGNCLLTIYGFVIYTQ